MVGFRKFIYFLNKILDEENSSSTNIRRIFVGKFFVMCRWALIKISVQTLSAVLKRQEVSIQKSQKLQNSAECLSAVSPAFPLQKFQHSSVNGPGLEKTPSETLESFVKVFIKNSERARSFFLPYKHFLLEVKRLTLLFQVLLFKLIFLHVCVCPSTARVDTMVS